MFFIIYNTCKSDYNKNVPSFFSLTLTVSLARNFTLAANVLLTFFSVTKK